jgi:hypothetical protein
LANVAVAPVSSIAMTAALSISTTPRIDRRLDERSDSLTGLARWLESARRMLNLDALALADPAGCLVVGAGSAQRCEEMAALAPLGCDTANDNGLRVSALSRGQALLCAPNRQMRTDDWQAVAQGCIRILGWNQAC